jgi:serine/threonine protein phosphatase PrpC
VISGEGEGWRAVGATHVGQRSHNEDHLVLAESLALFVVADGVGGHEAGEVASQLACEILQRCLAAGEGVQDAIQTAHRAVLEAAENGQGRAGMATTVVVLQLLPEGVQIAWVGDSRAYLWDGQLKLLTRDHSLVESLLARGEITFAEARHHPRRNVIAQAVGLAGTEFLQIGVNQGSTRAGQRILLCSDGLNDVVDAPVLARVLRDAQHPQHCAEQLLEAALAGGGRDNITVVVLDIDADRKSDSAPVLLSPVWTYDPDSDTYSGVAEQPQTKVRKIAPRSGTGTEAAADTTALISPVSAAHLGALPPRRSRITAWALVLAALAVIGISIAVLVDFWGIWQ